MPGIELMAALDVSDVHADDWRQVGRKIEQSVRKLLMMWSAGDYAVEAERDFYSKTIQEAPALVGRDADAATWDAGPARKSGVQSERQPQLSIYNCRFLGNRARSVVAHSNVQIEGTSFSGCSISAIFLAPDAHWMEGPTAQNVTVTRNEISNCGYGKPSDHRGAVCIDTHDPHGQTLTAPRINHFPSLNRYVPTNALVTANLRWDVDAGCELSCSG